MFTCCLVEEREQSLQQAQAQWKSLFSRQSTEYQMENPVRPTTAEIVLTKANRKANQAWGDELKDKPTNVTRVYSQNVNGLSIDRRGGQFADVCRVHNEVQADIFLGQEHNLDTTQMHIQSSLHTAAQQLCKRARVKFGTTSIQFKTAYKPGGTFIMSTGSISGRMSKQRQDPWGRWVLQEFTGKNNRLLVVVSAYQTVNKRGDQGALTVVSQQRSLLIQQNDPVSIPRTAFRRDLLLAMKVYFDA